MGVDVCFMVGIVIDVNVMLCIFFSWFGKFYIGLFSVYVFNVLFVCASGGIIVERGGKI